MLLQVAACVLALLLKVGTAAVHENPRGLGSLTPTPQAERAALFAFYTALGGSKWTWRDTSANGPAWDVASLNEDGSGSVDVCAWQGIQCDCSTHKHPFQGANKQEFYYDDVEPVPASVCHITKIQLTNMGLEGSLPSSLHDLAQLKVLQLGYNALTGNLDNLAGLVSLTKIHLQSNKKIGGQLPTFLQSFVSLKSLWLYDNSITGSIPTSFGNLFQLQSLIMHSNFLTGSLPSTLSQCTLLKALDLSRNLLIGDLPSSYASLRKMSVFRINANKGIGGILPPAFSSWTEISSFHIEDCIIQGVLPDSYSAWTHVSEVSLGNNRLAGTIPDSWSSFAGTLTLLDLHDNCKDAQNLPVAGYVQKEKTSTGVAGSIPQWVATASKLQTLNLSGNKLTGQLPSSLGSGLTALVTFSVGLNHISGPLQQFSSSALTVLLANDNKFTGTMLSLQHNTNLRAVNVARNALHGSLPSVASTLESLTSAHFGGNAFSGSIDPEYGRLKALEELYLNFNVLTGALPDMSGSSNLVILQVDNNRLDKPLPATMAAMQKLKYFAAWNNAIPGPLPTDLSSMASLETLFLHKNLITGSLEPLLNNDHHKSPLKQINLSANKLTSIASDPSKLSSLVSVYYLDLSSNELGGPLSESIFALANLTDLVISNNRWSGSLPASLGSLPRLKNFMASNCAFTGTLPSQLGEMSTLEKLDLSANLLEGTIPFITNANIECLALAEADPVKELRCITGLAKATNLKVLALHNNKFSGHLLLPDETQGVFAAFKQLSVLNLAKNHLTSSIPQQVGLMTALTLFDVSFNLMSGAVPQELGADEGIKTLRLNSNSFSGAFPALFCPVVGDLGIVNITGNHFSCYDGCWSSSQDDKQFSRDKNLAVCQRNPECPTGESLPMRMMVALKELYLSTKGPARTEDITDPSGQVTTYARSGWKWRADTDGMQWDFSMDSQKTCFLKDPCKQKWQGVDCSCSSSSGPDLHTTTQDTGTENFYYDDKNDVHDASGKCFVSKLELVDMGLDGRLPPVSMRELQGMTHLQLGVNHITGFLPDSLQELSDLVLLEILDNKIQGSLPSWIGNLRSLKTLLVQINNFEGPIPSEIGLLSALEEFKGSHNRFESSIPSEIASLSRLRVLELATSYLHGPVPATSFNALKNLEYVDLSSNDLTGSFDFVSLGTNCRALHGLKLDGNKLSGELPKMAGSSPVTLFPALTVLNLAQNAKISGALDSTVFALPALTEVYLGGCAFSGALPVFTGASSKLSVVDLSNNAGITGPIDASIGSLTSLTFLDVSGCKLTGSLSTQIKSMTALKFLSVAGNQLSGSIFGIDFSNLKSLETLLMNDNHFTSSLAPSLSELSKLQCLRLGNNKFKGTLPSFLGSLGALTELNLSKNSFSGAIFSTVGNLKNLVLLELSHCGVSGMIPDSLGSAGALKALYLGGNMLSGSVPQSFSQLTALVRLDLSANRFKGHIPILNDQHVKSNLQLLFLNDNQWSGDISSVYPLTALRELDLGNNNLEGDIGQIGQLTSIVSLVLKRNKFNGEIPSSLASMSKAMVLDFSFNSLGGTLPSDLDKLGDLKRLIANNCNFQGSIPALPRGLKLLDLRFNKLSGSLDFNSLQQLRKLKSLRASDNELSGQLGSGVGGMVSLQELILAKNSLQGSLPEAISLLTDLELLDLAHNLFTSSVPPSYASLTNMHIMDLDGNKLNGRLEQMFCHSGNADQSVYVSGPLMEISCIAPCWGASKNVVTNPDVKVCSDAPPPSAVVHNFPTRPPRSSHPTSPSKTADGYLPVDEVNALKAFYNALNGDSWRWRDNTDGKMGIRWNFSPSAAVNGVAQTTLLNDPCHVKWQGVICSCKTFPAPPHESGPHESGNFYYDDDGSTTFHGSSSVCSVEKLQLVDFGLDGTLPDEVWAFSSMTHAQLSDNFIAGTLPAALKYWTSVEKLHLNNNRLEGSLSGEIVQAWAEKMSQLWLDGNRLGGPLPSELGKLDKLEQLALNNNAFQGGLPVALAGCTSLESLALHFNQLNGPLDPQGILPKLHSLRNISVAFNHFTGPLPSNLNALTSLEALLVQHNELSGQLRDDIVSDESTLKKIDVSANKLTGDIPASFSKLRRLELLSVGQNAGIGGSLPDNLADLTALEILHVSQTKVDGTLPSGLEKLTNLRVLDISDTAVHGASLPSELGSITLLEIISFSGCNFLDATIPHEWGQLANLKTLDLTKTGVRGPLPTELSGLKSLENLLAGSCRLSGPLPSDVFEQLPNLVSIQLSRNLFTGGLPAALSDLVNLEEISLADCLLSGALPVMSKLRKLRILNVGGNKKINGQFPASITTLSALTLLDLSDNQIGGTIPLGLASLKLLDAVVLSRNLLEGTLPSDIANLGFCSKLDVGFNNLQGTIPADLSKMQKLRFFWASHNKLESPLPNLSGIAGTLKELDLAYNKFQDPSIPALLFKLTGLQLLDLSGNGIKGSISSSLGQLTRLTQLDLSSMALQGPLPAVVALLTNLVGLHVHNNKLTGTLPSDLFYDKNKRAGLSKAAVITLGNNGFSGPIPSMQGLEGLVSFAANDNKFTDFPANLGSNPRLRALLLHNNLISAPIPSSIGQMSALEHLVLSSNLISKTIPDLSALTNLQSLMLDHNQLTQNVPDSIAHCTELVELRINSNLLGGGLPLFALRHLPKLSILDLSGNQFNGPLSEDVAGMSALVELSLGGNQIFGILPPGLGQLTALKRLGLSSNEFVGTIPFALNALTNLVDLELQWNALTGPVPGLFCSSRNLPVFNVTNNPGLVCVRDCLLANKNFLYNRRLPVCSNVAAPTLAPTYKAVKTSPPSSSGIMTRKTVVLVSMYVSGASYDTVALNRGPYILSVKAAFVSVLGVQGLSADAFFQPKIWNDPDGSTDDGSHAAGLSLNLRRSRDLAATALVDVQFTIASNLPALTFSAAQASIQAAANNGDLTTALRKAATSQGAVAFATATVVKVNVQNGKNGSPSASPPSSPSSPSIARPTSAPKPAKPSKASTYSGLEQAQDETTVNDGEVVGVVLGLAATLLAIIAAVHYRHRLVKAWDSSFRASSSKSAGDAVPGPSPSAPNAAQPQLGRRDSIPLSQPGMMEMTDRPSASPARINPNTFAINQVYTSDNPMHD